MRSLFSTRAFWIVTALALVGLSTASWLRHEPRYGAVYAVLAAVAIARLFWGASRKG